MMKKTLIALSLALATSTTMAAGNNDHSHMAQGEMNHGEMNHGEMNHGEMNHATMDHSTMDHSTMNHADMDDSKMDHSNMMNMEGMSAVGMPAMGAKPDKVVHVILTDDMRINFKKDVKIEPNDVVQFVVMNAGKIDHEFSIGSMEEQLKHREMMKTMTGHHDHDSGSTVTVKPGKAKQLLWHFHGDKNVEFACNIPGHAEAGMVKSVQL